MKFKKLTLIGFKSFANKTDVKFGEGITAIVGPNGCGKSNVADAVRWVLGEQSAKLLRGSNMQDVIFNGTEKRSSQSYAEVSLTFDNKNRSLFPSYEYEEVVISRKLFRSGESEYYRNGSLCRLRDISEMLRDGGFAIEGYTIIGQGRVMEIINSKPEDRRSIFEEAAGITKYKFKKTEAERRNARTRENLVRIDDAMAGDLSRLEPLTKQAEKARTYFDLKEKLKYHEINLYINQYESASDTQNELDKIISEFDEQIKQVQADYDKATDDYNFAVEKLRNIDTDIEESRNELLRLSVGKEKVAGQIEIATQKLNSLRRQNESLLASNSVLGENHRNLMLTAEQKQDEYNRKSEALKSVQAEYDKLNAEYTAVADKVAVEEAKIESARRALMNAMERKVAVSMNMGELSAERVNVSEHIELLRASIKESEEKLSAGSAELASRNDELAALADEKSELIAEHTQKTDASADCAEKLKVVNDKLLGLNNKLSGAVTQKNMLTNLIESMEGFAVPVRKLLTDAKTDDRLRGLVKGVVGNIINIREGFGTAIEMALGAAANNIVTEDENDAKYIIEYLKKRNYGRITFLPLSGIKPRSIDPQYERLLNRQGCYGVATNVITFDPYFKRAVDGLLGGTVIVDNMDTAISLAKDSRYGFKIVTLDGDVLNAQGSITGGSKGHGMSNMLSYERELKEVAAVIDSLNERIEALNCERDALSARGDEYGRRLKELVADIHEYEVAEAAKTAEFVRLKDSLTEINKGKTSDESALSALTERLESIIADLDAVEKTQDELGTDARTEETERINSEFAALRDSRDALRDRVASSNLQIVTIGKDMETLENDVARLKAEAIATAQNMESNDMAILDNNRMMEQFNVEIRELSDVNSGGNEERRNELQSTLDNLAQYKADLNNKTVESDRLRIECNKKITELTEKKHEQEILLTRVDSDMRAMEERVREAYDLGYEECLQFKDEAYDRERGSVEVAKLRRRIDNLGHINENAIEESQELSKIYQEKVLQRDDLVKSLADEERVIKEMSANMLRDFNNCFEQIRQYFREIFKELFNGGNADLELTENEDPLLRGVEIKAQPPSKNLQSISLLSGGEKTLTAIAILFAILKLRPMPFCLLDEIEAALDDANVGRVANALKKFSAQTQLIAITHRKPTMEQADSLYGVTMEEKGVSTIVSVRLADAVKAAESVPAE